jgi:hypothetical protein
VAINDLQRKSLNLPALTSVPSNEESQARVKVNSYFKFTSTNAVRVSFNSSSKVLKSPNNSDVDKLEHVTSPFATR